MRSETSAFRVRKPAISATSRINIGIELRRSIGGDWMEKNMTRIDDLAQGFLDFGDKTASEIRNVGGPSTLRISDSVRLRCLSGCISRE